MRYLMIVTNRGLYIFRASSIRNPDRLKQVLSHHYGEDIVEEKEFSSLADLEFYIRERGL